MKIRMYEHKRPFSFPRITGVLDDGSDSLNAVRQNVSFRAAVRFVNDPMIFNEYPPIKNQIIVGFMNNINQLAWQMMKDKVYVDILITTGDIIVPSDIGKTIISDKVIYGSSKIMPENEDNLVIRTAYLLSITHLTISGVKESDFINICDASLFNKTVWVTNIFKNKTYEDRKRILQNLRTLINKEDRSYDDIVIFGEKEYLQKIPSDKEFVKTIEATDKSGVEVLSNIFTWVFNNYPAGTVAFILRQEASEYPFSTIRSVSRMDSRSIICINPFILPDIPDPRPELFQRGDPRTICGYAIKIDKNTDMTTSMPLKNVSLYSLNHHQVVMSEMMMRRYTIGNGTRNVGIGFPNLKQFSLEKNEYAHTNGVICPEVAPISFYNNSPGRSIRTLNSDNIMISEFPELNTKELLETRTLMNMTNKSLVRVKCRTENLINEKSYERKNESYNVFNGDKIRFKRKAWFDNKKMISQGYWNDGVGIRETGFVHRSELLNDCTIIPKTSDNIIDQACKVILLDDVKTVVLDINAGEENVFKSLREDLHFRDFDKTNIFGGKDSYFVSSDIRGKDLGFCPTMVRLANRKYHDTLGIDFTMLKALGEINGIVLGGKWSKSLMEIVCDIYPSIKWKNVKSLNDIKVEDFTHASFVVGTQDSDAWCGIMFVNSEHCKIVEIAYEHDTNPKAYYLSRGVGVDYKNIPLKNEPKKRCLSRIRDNLTHYLGNE